MTNPLKHQQIAYFGRLVVEHARDISVRQWDRTVNDGLQGESARARELLSELGPTGRELLKEILPAIIDTTLHQVMFLLEQGDAYGITVSVTTEDGSTCHDLGEESDGLSGDLVHWISAFSKERHKPFPGTETDT